MGLFLNLSTIFVLILIGTGAILMIISLVMYRRIIKDQDFSGSHASGNLNVLNISHLFLMGFFIVGYVVVFTTLIAGVKIVSELFVGLIFFFGAVFVLFGVVIQQKMMSCLQSTYTDSVKMLVSAVEIRDPYTIGHSEHVANLLILLWDYLPVDIREKIPKGILEHAGLLHDIGKIGVPEDVLNKVGRLSEEEWALIRQHPMIGSTLIAKRDDLKGIIDWIKYHHERIDGNGYQGLPGKAIPFVSRMIAVADTYSALVTDRPYRKGKSHQDALAIMYDISNTQLDEELTSRFASIPDHYIKACRPDTLVRNYIEELQKIDTFFEVPQQAGKIDIVFSSQPGALVLQKLLDYAVQGGLHLSVAILELDNIAAVDRDHGYHAVDELTASFGEVLLQNVRGTDLVINRGHNSFFLAFSECQLSIAMGLVQRIQMEIEAAEFYNQYADVLSISKTFSEYDPNESETIHEVRDFILGSDTDSVN